jgi:hypothetical protein
VCEGAELVSESVEFLLNLGGMFHLHGQRFVDVLDSPLQDEDFFVF